jgi:4,5-DOPA dioxygenase extradiol
MLPALFISHGAPTLPLEDIAARRFLSELGGAIDRPTAVLVVSAHWETPQPRISAAPRPETIHDFYGFPEALYRLTYPAPGAPDLADHAVTRLRDAGVEAATDPARGLDHGAWVPLMLMYPDATLPVTQISIQPDLGPAHHLAVGRALAPLREDGVLILASGSAVHNLRELAWDEDGGSARWAQAFDAWLTDRIERGATEDLVAYRERAPHAVRAHPRDEHLLPLFTALGAGGPEASGRRIHASFTRGSLSMAAFSFS